LIWEGVRKFREISPLNLDDTAQRCSPNIYYFWINFSILCLFTHIKSFFFKRMLFSKSVCVKCILSRDEFDGVLKELLRKPKAKVGQFAEFCFSKCFILETGGN
jgi:hypothetical protein